jgi:hypothetical protein
LQKELGNTSKCNLELKIKMLNDVGVMKKRSPMGDISKYFDQSEEVKECDGFHVSINVIKTSDEGIITNEPFY